MGTYQGGDSLGYVNDFIVTFNFYNCGCTGAFTSDGVGLPNGPKLNPTGLPNGAVDTTLETMTVDLGSWYWYNNGNAINGGTDPGTEGGRTSAAATGTYNPLTHEFDISWYSLIVGGSCDGVISYWNLTGTAEVSAVPVPAAVWLFGSGLLGLFGIARKRNIRSI